MLASGARAAVQAAFLWLALLARTLDGQVAPGVNYRIKLLQATAGAGQPGGWYLNAHRNWAGDRRDTESTYAIVRREPDRYWAGLWEFENVVGTGGGAARFRIKLVKGQHGQGKGVYLNAFRRDVGDRRSTTSSYLVAANSTESTAGEWVLEEGTRRDNGAMGYRLRLAETHNSHARNWYLDVHRIEMWEKRSNDSTYVQVAQTPQGAEWKFENPAGCEALCRYDAPSRTCHASRSYTAEVFRNLPEPWGKIAAHIRECEVVGRDHPTRCELVEGCQLDGYGRCSPSRNWTVLNLAGPPSGGVTTASRLGEFRCGIFGDYLRIGANCSQNLNPDSCEVDNPDCGWDVRRGACDISQLKFVQLLRRGFRDEFAKVSLLREHCEGRSEFECDGECGWIPPKLENTQERRLTAHVAPPPPPPGRCSVPPLDALLAISGEDCALSSLFRRQIACRKANDEENCTAVPAGIVSDTSPRGCQWLGTRCEAQPLSLELDVLPMLGMSSVQAQILAADQLCEAATSEEECGMQCVPRSGATATQSWHWLLGMPLLSAVSFWAATTAHLS